MKPFHFTLAAEEDLERIETHLAEHSDTAGESVIDYIETVCRLLGDHPGAGRQREELGPGVRSFPAGSYVVFYKDGQDVVVILRILHGHRDIPNVF